MAKKKKKTRKELLKREDAFLAAAGQSAQWAKHHRTTLVAAVIAVIVGVVAVWGGAEFMRQRDQDASGLFEEALALWDAEVITEDDDNKADPQGDPPTFASEAQKSEALRKKLDAVVERAGGLGVGELARFYVASHEEDADDPAAAEKSYAALVNDLNAGDSLYFLAVERTAYLQEARGDKDAAIATLERLNGNAGNEAGFYSDWAKFHQGRLYQQKGEVDRARGLFEALEKDHADSDVIGEVKKRLDQIGRTPPPEPVDETAAAPGAPTSPGGAVAQGASDAQAEGQPETKAP